MITIDELKVQLAEHAKAVKDLEEALAIEASRKRVQELEHTMSRPGFYDDAELSKKVFDEVGDLKGKLNRFEKLQGLYDDAETSIFRIFYGFTFNGLDIDFVQFLYKEFTVFRIHNGLYGSTENFYTIFLKNSVFVEGNTAVQCRLSTKGKHNAIRTFFFDDFLYKIRSDRQEINLVGNAFRSLHSSDIRVDKNGVDTFFFQGLQCL